MFRSRTGLLALVLWAAAVGLAFSDEDGVHRLVLGAAIAATTVAAVDRHTVVFREVIRLTLFAVSVERHSQVAAEWVAADDGE